jgi:hypothetical protein
MCREEESRQEEKDIERKREFTEEKKYCQRNMALCVCVCERERERDRERETGIRGEILID